MPAGRHARKRPARGRPPKQPPASTNNQSTRRTPSRASVKRIENPDRKYSTRLQDGTLKRAIFLQKSEDEEEPDIDNNNVSPAKRRNLNFNNNKIVPQVYECQPEVSQESQVFQNGKRSKVVNSTYDKQVVTQQLPILMKVQENGLKEYKNVRNNIVQERQPPPSNQHLRDSEALKNRATDKLNTNEKPRKAVAVVTLAPSVIQQVSAPRNAQHFETPIKHQENAQKEDENAKIYIRRKFVPPPTKQQLRDKAALKAKDELITRNISSDAVKLTSSNVDRFTNRNGILQTPQKLSSETFAAFGSDASADADKSVSIDKLSPSQHNLAFNEILHKPQKLCCRVPPYASELANGNEILELPRKIHQHSEALKIDVSAETSTALSSDASTEADALELSSEALEAEAQSPERIRIIIQSVVVVPPGEKWPSLENAILESEPVAAKAIPVRSSKSEDELHSGKFHSINAWLAKTQSSWCFKYKSTLVKMLRKEGLISTYKCMAKRCSYTTISKENFRKHLEYHDTMSVTSEFVFLCPYCFFKGDSPDALMNHYEKHLFDKFQCGYCFYRSASDHSCWEHVKTHHQLESPIVYECPLENFVDNAMYRLKLEDKRRRNISPLACSSETDDLIMMSTILQAFISQIVPASSIIKSNT